MTSLNAVSMSILFQHVSKHMEIHEYQKDDTTTE